MFIFNELFYSALVGKINKYTQCAVNHLQSIMNGKFGFIGCFIVGYDFNCYLVTLAVELYKLCSAQADQVFALYGKIINILNF